MCNKIYANQDQPCLLPIDLNDWISRDHEARFIYEFVYSLPIEEIGIIIRDGDTGRPPYCERMLLSIWLYGSLNRIKSSRKLEKLCRNDFGMVWLTGNTKPDHVTIWRFYKENLKAIKNVFKKSVQLAINMELTGMVVNALDGTKIVADVRQNRDIHREDLCKILKEMYGEKLTQKLAEVSEKEFDSYAKEVEKAHKSDDGADPRLPEKYSDQKLLRDDIVENLRKLDDAGADHLNSTDPDARMIKNGKQLLYSFNAQAMVDSVYNIIMDCDVSQDAMDSRNLTPMLAGVAETAGFVADVTLADSGYYSGSELAKAEEMGAEVLVNEKLTPTTYDDGKGDFSRENFEYDELNDEYHCPHGGVLAFSGKSFSRKKGSSKNLYTCQSYYDCPFRNKCSPKRRRCIAVSEFKGAINRQREKQKLPENKALLERRKMIVEPVFGNIKHNMGFRRWTVRGIENVCAQWALVCLIVNLKTIYKAWAENK